MLSAPWLFLAASLWGAVFTANALRPIRGPWPFLTFFPAWLTTELAAHHIVWQAVASAVFIAAGALSTLPGQIGMVITLVSWVGLGWLLLSAHSDGSVIHRALEAGLGSDYRDDIGTRFATPMKPRFEWHRIVLPFRMGHHSVERIRGIYYADDGHHRHTLDIYRRRDLQPGAPVLMQIHGGAWMIGNKEQQGLPLMNHLAARGWICVSINYRLSPEATWPDHLVDCKQALAWIREHIAQYGGDPDFVIVTGGSAGGHLTAMMGLTANDPQFQPGFEDADTRVQGFVPFYGVFDWTDRFGIRGDDGLRRRLEDTIVKRNRDEHPEVYENASPLSHVSADVPPVMVLHGAQDTIAPVEEARRFVDALRETSHQEIVYAEFAGAHHAFELFPSIRALHAIHGVESFVAWVASQRAQRNAAQ